MLWQSITTQYCITCIHQLHTVRVESLGALRTLDVDPSLLQLDFYVDLEAVYTRQMGAVSEERKMFHRRRMETERALPNLRKSFQNWDNML